MRVRNFFSRRAYPRFSLFKIFACNLFIVSLEYKVPLEDVDEHLSAHRTFLEECYKNNTFIASGGINTHSIVIANTGRKPALKVRVGHYPRIKDVQNMIAIHPAQRYDIEATPDAGEEVIFERILPKQAITITYIYSAGLTFNQITAYVRSDESEAKFLPVTINRWFPRWFLNILLALVFIGFVTVVYYGYVYGMVLLARLNLLNSLPSP